MPQQNYEIRVRSRLGGTFRTAFPGLGARTQGNLTVLSGSLVDRAEPDGVLAMIETLGPELIELRRATPFSQLRGYVKVQKRAVNRSLHFAADLWPGRPPLC